jgi:hypothetical protein
MQCLLLCAVFVAGSAAAEKPLEQWQDMPSYYHRNYLFVGAARAVPIGPTTRKFAPGKPGLLLGYRHHHSLQWYSSIGGQYLFLRRLGLAPEDTPGAPNPPPSKFALARLYLENSYLFRLYHPAYLNLGFRLFYLNPLQPPFLPNSRNEDFKRELGVSVLAGLMLFSVDEISLQTTAELWRGVATSTFHGAEFALLFAKRL